MTVFRLSLAMQMLIATFLGLIFGLFLGDVCQVFEPYAAAYIMVLKITAVPYLIGAIIHGVSQLSASQAKMIVKKGIIFILIAWAVNIAMIYTTYLTFPRPSTKQLTGYISGALSSINFAELLIPENIFYDLSHNIVPAVVIFSLLIGIALMQLKEKQTLVQGFQIFVESLTKITGWIARITPIGTFFIIANQTGTIEFSTIKQVSSYIILYIICLSTIIFWIFPRITSMLTGIPSYRWLQQMFPILLLAYTTNIVIICLPYMIELLRKETLSIDPYDEKAQNQIQGTVSVIFNLPMGSLFITLFVLFISLFYNTPLTISNQSNLFLTSFLTSLGAVGVGSWINSLTFVLDSLGLPQDAISLFLSTIPFTAGFQAMISAMEITSLALLIILATRKLIRLQLRTILSSCVITIIPVALIFTLIKNSNLLPEIKNDKKSIFELSISSSIPVSTYTTTPPSLPPTNDVFQRILDTKILRVGYCPDIAPFSFPNLDHNIVGYDIAFAYELAYDLGCALELIPMTYEHVIEELENGVYDIAMSGLSVNEQRLKKLSFTESYLHPQFVFISRNSYRKQFSSLTAIQSDPSLKIGVLRGTSYETTAKELFPYHELLLLDSPDEYPSSNANALFWIDAEALAWSLSHRDFRVIFPSPEIGCDSLAYAIRPGNPRFFNYLNRWLELKKTQGYTEKQYNLWVLQKTEIATILKPRWSLIRYFKQEN